MPLLVGERAAADEALRRSDLAGELGMAAVDPGVDDRDLDPCARKRRKVGPRVERPVLREVPLTGGERVVGREGVALDGRGSGACEDERRERGRSRAPQPFTTWSTRVVPGTKPRPGIARAR